MFAKARQMRDGSWIVGYPVICQKNHYIIPKDAEKVTLIPIRKDTICRYTGKDLPDGQNVYENDIIEIADADGTKIRGIVRFGTYHSEFDTKETGHVGFFVDWETNKYWRKDLGYWIDSERVLYVGNTADSDF